MVESKLFDGTLTNLYRRKYLTTHLRVSSVINMAAMDETIDVHYHFDNKKLVAWLKHSIFGEDVTRSQTDSETSELEEDSV